MNTQLSDECKLRLFRVTLHLPVKGMAFVMADSREAAWRIGKTVLAVLHALAVYDVELKDIHSFRELVQTGVSDDEDMRVFEVAHAHGTVTEWASTPYFLTNDATLLGKWAELRADLAANVARTAIRRAK
jgi:sulfate adenylyltransferase subunit 1 (EFTu-like GTPase family)